MLDLATRPSLEAISRRPWDLLVIGGGITGAGIMREAARRGLRVLLVERADFASGTSGRSSKLVHGGLHYLMRGRVGLARRSVVERERLVRAGRGLVEPVEFLVPTFPDDRLPPWAVALGLSFYDALAGRFSLHRHLGAGATVGRTPGLTLRQTGAFAYSDAAADDARLVLRVLGEGCRLGGCAVNYVDATEVVRGARGRVVGARLRDGETGDCVEVEARAVVNATGPWADRLRGDVGAPARLRLVRGSHLVFPASRLCLGQALVTRHPDSRLPIYFVPWEGVTLVGSTHIEHGNSLDADPRPSPSEIDYLLRGVQCLFPNLGLEAGDLLATFAGVRPIVDTRTKDPARAARDCALWDESGLLTVTGGKLTTFRLTASRALDRLRGRLPELRVPTQGRVVLDPLPPLPPDTPFDPETSLRLLARYGARGLAAIAVGPAEECRPLPGLATRWGELRWAARAEGVRHLDDLLLRRVRLGLTAPEGGIRLLDEIRRIVQPELGWDDDRWEAEAAAYREKWHRSFSVAEEPQFDPAAVGSRP